MAKAARIFTVFEGILGTAAAIFLFVSMDMPIGLAFVLPVVGVMVAETCISTSKGFKSVALGVLNIIYCARIGGILYLIWKPDPVTVVVEVPNLPEGLPESGRVEGVTKDSSVKVNVEFRKKEG